MFVYEVIVTGLSSRNMLEMHINIHRKICDGIELLARIEQGRYLVAVIDKDDNDESRFVGDRFRAIIDGVFREYIEDHTLSGYVDKMMSDYLLNVRVLEISDDLIEDYKRVCKECADIESQLSIAHLQSMELLRRILHKT